MHVSSLIRSTLGLKGHHVKSVREEAGGIFAKIVANKRSRPVCSVCGRKRPCYDTLKERRWRHIPLWGKPVTLLFRPRRAKCKTCGIKVEKIPWSSGKSPLSLPLIILLATYAKILALEEVARLTGVHWNTVRAAVKAAVDYGLEHRETASVIAIGVDEISRRKGHKYMTMVYDLSRMRLLWCGEGRDKNAIQAFFNDWGEERCKAIKAVCCDMWQPYIDVIEEMLPNAVMVFDKFHIIAHLSKAIDEVRREEARKLKDEGRENILSKTRYIFLKNPENLTDKQRLRLSDLEKLNLKINRAYVLKEAFRCFWDYTYRANAKKYLDKWFWWATHSRIEQMRDFAWMIRNHEEQILNYFKVPITNAAVEGMNRKAKVVSQRAYGYRTVGTFQLALYHVLGDLPMPETTHRFL
ncbi:MAG: ISL3 family transposase [Planctomycetes bacterium]|nr:ISL3 family transposase [Planctomycetota bacterium]